jgi:SAM domain (Sterile alpha motif)
VGRRRLPHLTDQDLKDIGIPLGHRRKMLAAVAQLDDTSIAEARAPGSLKPQPPVASTSPATPEAAGERRHVTVCLPPFSNETNVIFMYSTLETRTFHQKDQTLSGFDSPEICHESDHDLYLK